MATQRIVSLIASATEIVCALGMEDRLVGRSHECDFPTSVRRLPVCTAPKFDIEGTSGDIDRRVKDVLDEGVSVYRVDAPLLKELRPTVIVTQSHCHVCAVSERDVRTAIGDGLENKPKIVSLSPNALADVWTDIERVATALEIPDRGKELVDSLKARLTAIAEKTRSLPNRPTVACVEWIEPLMAAGNWMPELVDIAGGADVFGKPGTHAPPLAWDQFRNANPEVIVVMPCGFDIPRTVADMPILARQSGWQTLRAVQAGRVFVADGNQYFNRPGPRLVESAEILAEILHPEVFAFGHAGIGWDRWMLNQA